MCSTGTAILSPLSIFCKFTKPGFQSENTCAFFCRFIHNNYSSVSIVVLLYRISTQSCCKRINPALTAHLVGPSSVPSTWTHCHSSIIRTFSRQKSLFRSILLCGCSHCVVLSRISEVVGNGLRHFLYISFPPELFRAVLEACLSACGPHSICTQVGWPNINGSTSASSLACSCAPGYTTPTGLLAFTFENPCQRLCYNADEYLAAMFFALFCSFQLLALSFSAGRIPLAWMELASAIKDKRRNHIKYTIPRRGVTFIPHPTDWTATTTVLFIEARVFIIADISLLCRVRSICILPLLLFICESRHRAQLRSRRWSRSAEWDQAAVPRPQLLYSMRSEWTTLFAQQHRFPVCYSHFVLVMFHHW